MAKFYITTAIDYPNASPHIGTAFEKIGADAMARWRRFAGDDVFFLMGNDENSQKVVEKAEELKLDGQAFCDQMAEKFKATWAKLGLSFDRFIRTTEKEHHAGAQEIFRRIIKKGDIYKGMYKSWYCIGCESRKTEKDLVEGRCPNHPDRELEWIEEENWFFRLTAYRDRVHDLVKNTDFVVPEIRRNEVLATLEEGLEDISVSRAKATWGVPIPDDPSQVIYVWFDALINYVTGIGFPDERHTKWWPADVHVIGKDITRFHCIIWPAMLMAADIAVPKQVFAHGFVYVSGQKASKSGRKIDPEEVADKHGADALRYFLLREIAFDNDGNFSWEKFIQRYNSELANDLGNLLHRTLNMIHRYLGGTIPGRTAQLAPDGAFKEALLGLPDRVSALMDKWQFHMALAEIFECVRRANTYLEATSPWTRNKEGKKDEVAAALGNAAEALRILAILLAPFLPASADRMWEQLGLEGKATEARLDDARAWDYIKAGTPVTKGKPLFPRIEDE
ncbi:MAG: methionine--tRNA ligase [Planctomycetota bacterium]|jgi:methionyl-tRNA synthetase